MNGKEKDDEIKGSGNSYDFGARMLDPRLGRWLSVDRQQNRYASFSPYNFVVNNPILFVDPDGEYVKIHGQDAQGTVAALQTKTSLKLIYDAKTNMLTATGKPKTAADIKLLEAINDKNVTVNLKTQRDNKVTLTSVKKTGPLVVGAYDGSKVTKDSEGNTKVETSQFFNLKQAENEQAGGGNSVGTNALHELLESYIGGVKNPGSKTPTTNPEGMEWNKIHNETKALDPQFKDADPAVSDKNGKGPDGKPVTPWTFSINGKNVDVQYVEPAPAKTEEKPK